MKLAKPITILLAEDHVVVRQGLSSLLNADENFKIVGETRTGREAVEMTLALRPDVILMDIAMPVLNGLEATKQILSANPSAKVLILSAYSDDEYVIRMRATGAAGFLEKQTSAKILTQAIHEVAKGKMFFSPTIARHLHQNQLKSSDKNSLSRLKNSNLTHREMEVLQMVAEGSANRQIATELGISIKTVEKHRQHLMDKLNIHDTAGLTRHALATGVIENIVRMTIT